MTQLNKAFKSEIDNFLEDFDKLNSEPSISQKEEIKKYARIGQLRDFPTPQESVNKTLDDF